MMNIWKKYCNLILITNIIPVKFMFRTLLSDKWKFWVINIYNLALVNYITWMPILAIIQYNF